jgi:hypothetical protein
MLDLQYTLTIMLEESENAIGRAIAFKDQKEEQKLRSW